MTQTFAEALVDAQGRSEFVIVVVADIRGFSAFSTTNESPNIAMFIKRFYLKLINNYFKEANFVKPTGDGLLMTFRYSEQDLLDVSERVIEACLTCLNDFPTICKDDPMINFLVPQAIGFGIARGTACCLFSGEQILDYSGHLLNLASRLNDLARPSGIVLDGNYLSSVIPEAQRGMFKEQEVYLRSIAEDKPMKVFYLDKYVRVSELSLSPLAGETWKTIVKTFTKNQFDRLFDIWAEDLPTPVKSQDKIKVIITVPKKGLKGYSAIIDVKDFSYIEAGSNPTLELNIAKVRDDFDIKSLAKNAKMTLKIEYVPRLLPRT
jgi:class 3 adenylate cyclase